MDHSSHRISSVVLSSQPAWQSLDIWSADCGQRKALCRQETWYGTLAQTSPSTLVSHSSIWTVPPAKRGLMQTLYREFLKLSNISTFISLSSILVTRSLTVTTNLITNWHRNTDCILHGTGHMLPSHPPPQVIKKKFFNKGKNQKLKGSVKFLYSINASKSMLLLQLN